MKQSSLMFLCFQFNFKVNISTYQNLALLHHTISPDQIGWCGLHRCESISTNRYPWIAKQMRLCRVKSPDSTGRTGINCSSRPAKKPLLASNSSPHRHRNVANFGEALKTADVLFLFNTLYRDGFQPITALLGVHWMLGIWIDRHRILRSVEVCGDFPLPTDDEATQELRNLDLGGN